MCTYTACAHPSLALVKYWGKSSRGINIPLTSSLAVAINRFTTTVHIRVHSSPTEERVVCDGEDTPHALYVKNYLPFFDHCRSRFRAPHCFWEVVIENNYPLAAGLASSSAIYAALSLAINEAHRSTHRKSGHASALSKSALSAVARRGSTSAARALFGGFVLLPAHSTSAHCYMESSMWPDLRIVIAYCSMEQKPISSREAMKRSRDTSPLFRHWKRRSTRWYREAKSACRARDLERLGWAMQQSYLTMFATMHTARPPIFYWNEHSIAVIKQAHLLRQRGVAVWETADAGPQVKLLTTTQDADAVLHSLRQILADDCLVISELGAPPYIVRNDTPTEA